MLTSRESAGQARPGKCRENRGLGQSRSLSEICKHTSDTAAMHCGPKRHIMFAVEDIDDVVARLRAHGSELVGELVQ